MLSYLHSLILIAIYKHKHTYIVKELGRIRAEMAIDYMEASETA